MDWDATRPGETEGGAPARVDAGLVFIGRIRTPYATRDDCPRQGCPEGPVCRIDLARRDLLTQSPKSNGEIFGTFALRSPVRPNPIATAIVEVMAVEEGELLVRSLDCVDGTPLLDIKPDRSLFTPKAPPNPGEIAAGGAP
jgi:tRNA (adenine37-N6)-methyltransferase